MQNLRSLDLLAGRFFGIDNFVFQQLPLPVESDNFATRAKTRIDRQHGLLPERRGQQQLAQVVRENPDRLLICLLFVKNARLGLHGKTDQPLVTILHRQLHLLGRSGFVFDEKIFQRGQGLVFFRGETRIQKPLGLAATDGQNAVRRSRRRGLAPGEVVFEFRALFFLIHGDLGFDHALGDIEIAQLGAGRGVVVHPLGHDVARTGESLRRIGDGGLGAIDFVFASGVTLRLCRHIGGGVLLPEDIGQRLEAFLLCDGGLGALFRTEGQINIFQGCQRLGGIDFRL